MNNKQKIFIIGTGVIGFPMLVRCSDIKKKNEFIYDVYGYDRDIEKIVRKSKSGRFPFETNDNQIKKVFKNLYRKKRINFEKSFEKINKSEIIIISVGFDYESYENSKKNMIDLINKISSKVKKGTLILIETTLPPGFSDKIIIPIFKKNIKKNQLSMKDIFIGYSYERIMPGRAYYKSLINNDRSFSANSNLSKLKVKKFLNDVVSKNVKLFELDNIIDCELGKIIENSYRALNIAFIDQWNKLSLQLGLNLEKILDSIRVRSSHSNIMRSGLGVGGYCLTKDPLFVNKIKYFKKIKKSKFPLNNLATKINKDMPKFSANFIKNKFKRFKNKKILIIGLSYIRDFGDTRYSQGVTLSNLLKKNNKITLYDNLIEDYKNNYDLNKKNLFSEFDIVIFNNRNLQFNKIIKKKWNKKTSYFDVNNFFNSKETIYIKTKDLKFYSNGNYA